MTELNRESRTVRWGLSLAGVVLFMLAWQTVTEWLQLFNSIVLPSPGLVFEQYVEFGPLLLDNFWPTLLESAVGFAGAVSLALIVGTLLTYSERTRTALMPLILSGNSVPRVSLAPLIIFYIGVGSVSNYVIAMWVAFFPMLVNTMEGLTDIDEEFDDLLATFDATAYQEYRYIRFPHALPFIFDGMKIAISLSIVGAVVGEYVAANKGMGFLALIALGNYQMGLVFAVVGLMGIVAVAAFFALFLIQDRLVHWEETNLFSE